MDGDRFDRIARAVGDMPSRRDALRALVAGAFAAAVGEAPAEAEAAKRCRGARRCGRRCCPKGKFCCDPERGACCAKGDGCCNPSPGTGTCCARPNRCAKPLFDDDADTVCCPEKRQWFTTTGRVRCCPAGTRSLGTGITSDDGPCCPEKKFCGDTCCADGQICADPATGRCCPEGSACATTCCPTRFCYACVGGTCQPTCGTCQYCDGNGGCKECGVGCCGG